MKFLNTPLAGLVLIDLEPIEDERGFFARTFCADTFRRQGFDPHVAQSSIAFSGRPGTLRGMHYQRDPHAETKLVRCTRGTVYDVAIDLRPGSATFRHWYGTELTSRNRRMLYIPSGFAHGYLTLEPDTEISYQMSTPYRAEAADGVRWDDPAFDIRWPGPVMTINARDRSYPDFLPR